MPSNLLGSCLKGVVAACAAVLSVSGSAFGATKNVPSDYPTVEAAIAAAEDNDEIVIGTGTYVTTTEFILARPLTIRGATGKPEDVVIAASGKIRPFTLNDAGACIEAVTLANGLPNGNGGGVLLESKGGIVRNCVVTNCCANSWAGCGGAFYLNGANALVENCVVSNCWNSTAGGSDSAINYGGGIAAHLTSGTIRNTLFFHNVTSGGRANKGHVIALNKGGLVENCTVVGNHTYYGSGIWAVGVGKATVRNCLISDNTSYDDQTGTWTAWYGDADCFENCIAPVYINDTCIVDERSIRDFANGDFTPVGAAVDTGAESEWHATAVDLAGKARMSGTAPDIGCFELDQSVAGLDVKASVVHGLAPLEVVFTPRVFGLTGAQTIEWDFEGRGAWDVESADTVTKTFAAGRWTVRARVKGSNAVVSSPIEIVAAPKTIYVNPGCGTPEYPYNDEDHAATTVAEAYDVAVDGCAIVLAPMTHTLDDTLRVMKAVTVRGATDDAADTVMTLSASVKKRVVELQHPQASLSAVTVTGGACDTSFTQQGDANGGGAYVNACGGSISNCVFRDNKTTAWAAIGGALWVAGKSALVTHCVFSNNTCAASGSTSTDQGGGLAVYMTAGTLRNSLFIRNTSGKTAHANRGGSVFMTDGVIENCSFAKNAHTYASGVRATGGTVRNCLIGGNTCTGTASYEGHGEQWVGKAACFENCLTDGATPINDSCDVVNDPFTSVATEDLTPCAAAVDTATPQDWMEGATDLAGLARIQGKGPDLGCYEKDMSKFSAIVEVGVTKALAPYDATFTVTVFGVGDEGVTCSWDWDGDGTWDEATDGTVTHRFEAGSYSTRVLVTDKASGKTSAPELPFDLTIVPKTIYVDDASEHPASPYQNWNRAAKTLADAYAIAVDGCEIVMATGTYDVSTVLEVKQNVAIRSATGNPKDVVLRMADKASRRHFVLNNALASLSGMTLENGSGAGGGAILIEAFGGTVSNCVFSGNKSSSGWGQQGGAIYLNSADALVTHCVFTNNLGGSANGLSSGDTQGGGHALHIKKGNVRNCLFVGNGDRTHKASKGGVVVMFGGALENCTFAGNADGYCAGVRACAAAAVVRNCVFAEYDCPSATSEAMAVIFDATTASRFDHCCSPVEFGGSWIKTDAPFVDAAHGDWSPAAAIVDKAAPQDWMDGATDLAGNARVSGSAPDIGCYEKDQDRFSALVEVSALRAIAPYEATFTVTTFGVGDKGVTCSWDWNGDGTWDDTSIGTTTHVYDVGAHATKVKVVDNASGAVFEPAAPFDLLIAPKTICVDCNSENPSAPYQNWDCAAKTLADAYAVAVDGCEIVVATGTYDVSTSLEVKQGVAIRSATGNPKDVILRMADKASRRHFVLNNALASLSGMTLENGSGAGGGAILIEAFGGTVSNCVFSGNKSTTWGTQGGAIKLNSAAALVTHCVFTNNLGGSADNPYSGDYAGGAHAVSIASGTVRNCLFVGNGDRNRTNCRGGVVVMSGGALENCTFAGNADGYCAGVRACAAAAVVRNCLLAEYDCPSATSAEMAVIYDAATADRFDHCCSSVEFGGSWVKADDPQFRKPAKGDWRLKDKSPAVNAGIWCDWMDGATDLLGNPRKVLDNPDIGCYECPCSGLMLFVR